MPIKTQYNREPIPLCFHVVWKPVGEETLSLNSRYCVFTLHLVTIVLLLPESHVSINLCRSPKLLDL